ncbi:hypothetical protein BaRGS_00016544 [Batillaria attramentaria]|uniref:Uncharacterized protein n=1 Tax=Batillaria attramentaria TaxID=370345 RepID=A0ABD0KYM0_9CAEN
MVIRLVRSVHKTVHRVMCLDVNALTIVCKAWVPMEKAGPDERRRVETIRVAQKGHQADSLDLTSALTFSCCAEMSPPGEQAAFLGREAGHRRRVAMAICPTSFTYCLKFERMLTRCGR